MCMSNKSNKVETKHLLVAFPEDCTQTLLLIPVIHIQDSAVLPVGLKELPPLHKSLECVFQSSKYLVCRIPQTG